MNEASPEGWSTVALADAVEPEALIQYGILQPGPDTPGGVPYIRPTEIVNDEIDLAAIRRTTKEIAAKYSRSSLRHGDVVLSIVGSIGKVAIVPFALEGANITQSSARLRPRKGLVDSKYLAWFLRSPQARTQFQEAELGTGVPRLNIGDLRKMKLALPPLAEQRRIVSRVDALQARIGTAKDHLERVPLLVKRFRQEILAKALRGELVPTEAELAAREGRSHESPSAMLGIPPEEGNSDLPHGWTATTLNSLLPAGGLFDGPFGSSLKTSDYTAHGVRVIRLENVANLRFVADKETWISKAKYEELKRHSVAEGDIIFGSFVDETCRVCLLPKLTTPAIAKADCFCVRPRAELVDRKFLVYQLGSTVVRNNLVEEIHGATRPRINTGQLRALSIALPPLAEQRRIVRTLDSLFEAASKIEADTARQLKLLEHAPLAILQKAFSGELVATEAEVARSEGRTFEAAEQLLSRLESAQGAGSALTLNSKKTSHRTHSVKNAHRTRASSS